MKRLSFLLVCMICCITTMAERWTDPETGYTWSYTVSDNGATIGGNYWVTGDLVIPASINGYPVTSIGYQAFCDCSGLTSVSIPNSVTSIGDWAFRDCSGLTSVTIPNSVTSIGNEAFRGCSGLTSVSIPNSVASIGDSAFWGCTSLTSVSIPNSVTSIGIWAFYECSGLTSVTIGNSVTSIGDAAFLNCSGLTSVTIPNSVTSIGLFAFSHCTSLTSVTIGNSVTSIGQSAFSGCSGLTSITIPNSVTSIGNYLFSGCSDLTSLKVESGNTVYDSRDNCNAIIETATNTLIYGCMNTIIPNSVTSIGEWAFSGCSGLTSVSIPNSVTSIGSTAFSGCSDLTSVTIPNSVTSIGTSAFYGCSGLTSIKVESGNTKYDSRNNCNAIIETATNTLISGCKNTVIPNSVTIIGSSAFGGCSGLTSITIPNSVTSIGQAAFSGCSGLTSITIPNSVTTIGTSAFANCRGLTSVVSKMVNPCNINNSCFPNNVFENTTLYVPQGTIDKYQATESWNKFLHIEELNSSNMCATPTISYKNGKLSYNCETEGAICHTTITNEDIKSFDGNEIDLTVTYNISVYATKDGYFDSDVANATLCWIEVNPQNEGITTDVNQIASVAVLIKANGGQLTIEGADDNTTVTAYTLDGVQLGSAVSRNGVATINTNVSAGTVTIVKIGNKSVKVVMK